MSKGSNSTRSGASTTTRTASVSAGGGRTIASNVAARVVAKADQLAWTRNVSDRDLRNGISQKLKNGDVVTVSLRYEGRNHDNGYIETHYKSGATGERTEIASQYWNKYPGVWGQTKEEAMENTREYIRDNILNRQ